MLYNAAAAGIGAFKGLGADKINSDLLDSTARVTTARARGGFGFAQGGRVA